MRREIKGTFSSQHQLVKLVESCWDPDPIIRPSFGSMIGPLSSYFYTNILNDDDAVQMWSESFPDKDVVPLDDFYKALWKIVTQRDSIPLENEPEFVKQKCLEAVLKISDKKDTISIERFGQLLHWYGPLISPTPSPKSPKSPKTPTPQKEYNLFQKIEAILKEPWYHAEISSSEAEQLLNFEKGGFLVRCSVNSAPFTISRLDGKGPIMHHRVEYDRNNGIYKMKIQSKNKSETNEIKGESLCSFVKIARSSLKMKKVVENKKFKYIFENKTPIVGLYDVVDK